MTEQEQFAAINTRQWYTDMRTQLGAVVGAMQQAGFSIEGGWVKTQVGGVPARAQLHESTATLEAGLSQAGKPLFTWEFPMGWLA